MSNPTEEQLPAQGPEQEPEGPHQDPVLYFVRGLAWLLVAVVPPLGILFGFILYKVNKDPQGKLMMRVAGIWFIVALIIILIALSIR